MNNILNKSLIIPLVISLWYIIRIEITWTEGIDCFWSFFVLITKLFSREVLPVYTGAVLKDFSVEPVF